MTTTATHTAQPARVKHVVLAITNGQPRIHSVWTTWAEAIRTWETLDNARLAEGTSARQLHYAVREADQELVMQAATEEAAELRKAPRQAEVLTALAKVTEPHRPIQPGSRKRGSSDPRRWGQVSSLYSADMVAPARKLAARGLVTISGLDFAPKTYNVTAKGRLVAAAL